MKDPTEDRLDAALAQWAAPEPAPGLAAEVRRRLSPRWFRQPAFLVMTAVSGLLLVLLVGEARALQVQKEHNQRLAQSYLRMIDPLLGPPPPGKVEEQIGWMRSELSLSAAQFALILRLHEATGPQIRAYAATLDQLRQANADVVRRWRRDDQVDFLDFAQILADERTVDRRCSDSLRDLVASSAAIMSAAQRKRYLALVHPLLAHAGSVSGG